MNAYVHKYTYKYTYICNCDSLIVGKFGSSKSKLEVTLRLTVGQSVCLGIKHPCATCDRILRSVGMLLSEICGHAYVLENCQQCGEPCFVGAAILTDGYLAQIPWLDKYKSLRI
jgi:hypothetical protein